MVKKILVRSFISVVLFLMYLPIFVLIVFSFTNTKSIGNFNGFTLELYQNMFKDKDIMIALKNTMIVAILSSIISTILGTLSAIGIFYSKKRTKKILEGINQISVVNAEIVIAFSLTLLFTFIGTYLTDGSIFGLGTLLIGHTVLTLPFVILNVTPKLKQMDNSIYEAALDLGATPAEALFKVVLPQILPGILSGFLLSITLSLDDYIITAFTRDNSFNTLSTYIEGIVKKSGLPNTLRALTTLIFIVMLFVLILVNMYSKKVKAKEEGHA